MSSSNAGDSDEHQYQVAVSSKTGLLANLIILIAKGFKPYPRDSNSPIPLRKPISERPRFNKPFNEVCCIEGESGSPQLRYNKGERVSKTSLITHLECMETQKEGIYLRQGFYLVGNKHQFGAWRRASSEYLRRWRDFALPGRYLNRRCVPKFGSYWRYLAVNSFVLRPGCSTFYHTRLCL